MTVPGETGSAVEGVCLRGVDLGVCLLKGCPPRVCVPGGVSQRLSAWGDVCLGDVCLGWGSASGLSAWERGLPGRAGGVCPGG